MEITFGGISIGAGQKPLVIPEIGINHEGNLRTAFEMVDAAKRSGARLIKHQTHIVEDEMSSAAKRVRPGNADVSIYEIMQRCALSEDEERELKEYTESNGLVFLSTPFSRAAVKRLERLGVKAFKVGSGEMNNYPLLDYIASVGLPMIVSTGMNSMDCVDKAVAILERRNVLYALMHTTNLYPTPPHLVRIGAMQELMIRYPEIPIGLSDHTTNNNACISAIAWGACVVERHFTDRSDRNGPDIVCSMDEAGLKELLLAAEQVPLMLGGKKEATKEEEVTSNFAFATVVSIAPIKKGDLISEENIWVKRPGIGKIRAESFQELLGRRSKIDIPSDTHLDYSMIE